MGQAIKPSQEVGIQNSEGAQGNRRGLKEAIHPYYQETVDQSPYISEIKQIRRKTYTSPLDRKVDEAVTKYLQLWFNLINYFLILMPTLILTNFSLISRFLVARKKKK